MKKIWQPLIKNFIVYIVETFYMWHHYICFYYSYCCLGKRCGPWASKYENILLNVNFFSMERQKKKSKTPIQSKYLSFKVSTIIIDRMDQSKTQIPHFEHDSEFTSSMWRLCVHLVSVGLYYIGILYMAFWAIWIQPTQSIWHYLFPWHYFICLTNR